MKFLFIHPFGIGDVIFSLAAAEALVRRGHTVDYLCSERTEDFLKFCPAVRSTHRFDRAALRSDLRARRWFRLAGRYAALRRSIASEKYDAALDFSMGREYAFLAWASGIRRRIGWDYKRRGVWLTERVGIQNFDVRSPRDYALDLARLADPRVGTTPAYPPVRVPSGGAPPATASIVIAPGGGLSWGANAVYKQWPRESWVELAKILLKETRMQVVVMGSEDERLLVEAVATQAIATRVTEAGRVVAAVGEPFDRVLSRLASARAFVGTDGGLLHLANLAGVPSVGIYGPVSELGYGTLDSAAPARILTADVPCRPCYRGFRFGGCAYDKRCLTSVAPERVAAETRALLAAKPL